MLMLIVRPFRCFSGGDDTSGRPLACAVVSVTHVCTYALVLTNGFVVMSIHALMYYA